MITGKYSLVSVISNVAPVGLLTAATAGLELRSASLVALLVYIQFLDQVKIKATLQLLNGISDVLKKLLRYFTGTTISALFFYFYFQIFL